MKQNTLDKRPQTPNMYRCKAYTIKDKSFEICGGSLVAYTGKADLKCIRCNKKYDIHKPDK